MEDQLQQLIELQKEQNRLLQRYLWRLRFSLLSLLLLTTITAIGLGFLFHENRTRTRNWVRARIGLSTQPQLPLPVAAPAPTDGTFQLFLTATPYQPVPTTNIPSTANISDIDPFAK
jgi:hypothetical protein